MGQVHRNRGSLKSADDWDTMEHLWQRELVRWGGADALERHWQRYRLLKHRFVPSDVMTEQAKVLEHVHDSPGSVIWWSNAFATVHSAWTYTLEEKQWIYQAWVDALQSSAPDMLIYGSDHSNSGVNHRTASQYWQEYCAEGGHPLTARSLRRSSIRF